MKFFSLSLLFFSVYGIPLSAAAAGAPAAGPADTEGLACAMTGLSLAASTAATGGGPSGAAAAGAAAAASATAEPTEKDSNSLIRSSLRPYVSYSSLNEFVADETVVIFPRFNAKYSPGCKPSAAAPIDRSTSEHVKLLDSILSELSVDTPRRATHMRFVEKVLMASNRRSPEILDVSQCDPSICLFGRIATASVQDISPGIIALREHPAKAVIACPVYLVAEPRGFWLNVNKTMGSRVVKMRGRFNYYAAVEINKIDWKKLESENPALHKTVLEHCESDFEKSTVEPHGAAGAAAGRGAGGAAGKSEADASEESPQGLCRTQ